MFAVTAVSILLDQTAQETKNKLEFLYSLPCPGSGFGT